MSNEQVANQASEWGEKSSIAETFAGAGVEYLEARVAAELLDPLQIVELAREALPDLPKNEFADFAEKLYDNGALQMVKVISKLTGENPDHDENGDLSVAEAKRFIRGAHRIDRDILAAYTEGVQSQIMMVAARTAEAQRFSQKLREVTKSGEMTPEVKDQVFKLVEKEFVDPTLPPRSRDEFESEARYQRYEELRGYMEYMGSHVVSVLDSYTPSMAEKIITSLGNLYTSTNASPLHDLISSDPHVHWTKRPKFEDLDLGGETPREADPVVIAGFIADVVSSMTREIRNAKGGSVEMLEQNFQGIQEALTVSKFGSGEGGTVLTGINDVFGIVAANGIDGIDLFGRDAIDLLALKSEGENFARLKGVDYTMFEKLLDDPLNGANNLLSGGLNVANDALNGMLNGTNRLLNAASNPRRTAENLLGEKDHKSILEKLSAKVETLYYVALSKSGSTPNEMLRGLAKMGQGQLGDLFSTMLGMDAAAARAKYEELLQNDTLMNADASNLWPANLMTLMGGPLKNIFGKQELTVKFTLDILGITPDLIEQTVQDFKNNPEKSLRPLNAHNLALSMWEVSERSGDWQSRTRTSASNWMMERMDTIRQTSNPEPIWGTHEYLISLPLIMQLLYGSKELVKKHLGWTTAAAIIFDLVGDYDQYYDNYVENDKPGFFTAENAISKIPLVGGPLAFTWNDIWKGGDLFYNRVVNDLVQEVWTWQTIRQIQDMSKSVALPDSVQSKVHGRLGRRTGKLSKLAGGLIALGGAREAYAGLVGEYEDEDGNTVKIGLIPRVVRAAKGTGQILVGGAVGGFSKLSWAAGPISIYFSQRIMDREVIQNLEYNPATGEYSASPNLNLGKRGFAAIAAILQFIYGVEMSAEFIAITAEYFGAKNIRESRPYKLARFTTLSAGKRLEEKKRGEAYTSRRLGRREISRNGDNTSDNPIDVIIRNDEKAKRVSGVVIQPDSENKNKGRIITTEDVTVNDGVGIENAEHVIIEDVAAPNRTARRDIPGSWLVDDMPAPLKWIGRGAGRLTGSMLRRLGMPERFFDNLPGRVGAAVNSARKRIPFLTHEVNTWRVTRRHRFILNDGTVIDGNTINGFHDHPTEVVTDNPLESAKAFQDDVVKVRSGADPTKPDLPTETKEFKSAYRKQTAFYSQTTNLTGNTTTEFVLTNATPAGEITTRLTVVAQKTSGYEVRITDARGTVTAKIDELPELLSIAESDFKTAMKNAGVQDAKTMTINTTLDFVDQGSSDVSNRFIILEGHIRTIIARPPTPRGGGHGGAGDTDGGPTTGGTDGGPTTGGTDGGPTAGGTGSGPRAMHSPDLQQPQTDGANALKFEPAPESIPVDPADTRIDIPDAANDGNYDVAKPQAEVIKLPTAAEAFQKDLSLSRRLVEKVFGDRVDAKTLAKIFDYIEKNSQPIKNAYQVELDRIKTQGLDVNSPEAKARLHSARVSMYMDCGFAIVGFVFALIAADAQLKRVENDAASKASFEYFGGLAGGLPAGYAGGMLGARFGGSFGPIGAVVGAILGGFGFGFIGGSAGSKAALSLEQKYPYMSRDLGRLSSVLQQGGGIPQMIVAHLGTGEISYGSHVSGEVVGFGASDISLSDLNTGIPSDLDFTLPDLAKLETYPIRPNDEWWSKEAGSHYDKLKQHVSYTKKRDLLAAKHDMEKYPENESYRRKYGGKLKDYEAAQEEFSALEESIKMVEAGKSPTETPYAERYKRSIAEMAIQREVMQEGTAIDWRSFDFPERVVQMAELAMDRIPNDLGGDMTAGEIEARLEKIERLEKGLVKQREGFYVGCLELTLEPQTKKISELASKFDIFADELAGNAELRITELKEEIEKMEGEIIYMQANFDGYDSDAMRASELELEQLIGELELQMAVNDTFTAVDQYMGDPNEAWEARKGFLEALGRASNTMYRDHLEGIIDEYDLLDAAIKEEVGATTHDYVELRNRFDNAVKMYGTDDITQLVENSGELYKKKYGTGSVGGPGGTHTNFPDPITFTRSEGAMLDRLVELELKEKIYFEEVRALSQITTPLISAEEYWLGKLDLERQTQMYLDDLVEEEVDTQKEMEARRLAEEDAIAFKEYFNMAVAEHEQNTFSEPGSYDYREGFAAEDTFIYGFRSGVDSYNTEDLKVSEQTGFASLSRMVERIPGETNRSNAAVSLFGQVELADRIDYEASLYTRYNLFEDPLAWMSEMESIKQEAERLDPETQEIVNEYRAAMEAVAESAKSHANDPDYFTEEGEFDFAKVIDKLDI